MLLPSKQLRFASGSLTSYLHVQSSEKLQSSATVDDVEGTLANFIPPGTNQAPKYILKCDWLPFVIDYYKDESAFEKRVEEEATNFKPFGELIYSYTRPSPTKGKRKRSANSSSSAESDITYEVYHVSFLPTPNHKSFTRWTESISVNMEYPRVPWISQKNANLHSTIHWSRFFYQWRRRSLGVYRLVSSCQAITISGLSIRRV
jgi:hypothetical protein